MHLPLRYFALALSLLVSFHYLATYTSSSYSEATHASLSQLRTKWAGASTSPVPVPVVPVPGTSNEPFHPARPSAAFVVLCRNSELSKMLMSLQTLESTFNAKPQNRYPYVFLNDVPFTDRFRARIRAAIPADVRVDFGLVPPEHWAVPDFIDRDKAEARRLKADQSGMPYGGSTSYRQMCRFQSGFFFRHPLVAPYRYYWRIEPNVRFLCDLETFDPFRLMRDQRKRYGFTLSLHEIPATVKTLWIHVREWYLAHPHLLAANNAFPFVTHNNGSGYSMCHFWSNFEIADLDFFRSPAYTSFFNHLDQAGGFFYERWGDAPIHSIAASLLLDRSEIHHFDTIGYMHAPFLHCPKDPPSKQGRCYCTHDSSLLYDDSHWSCKYQWDALLGKDPEAERVKFIEPVP